MVRQDSVKALTMVVAVETKTTLSLQQNVKLNVQEEVSWFLVSL